MAPLSIFFFPPPPPHTHPTTKQTHRTPHVGIHDRRHAGLIPQPHPGRQFHPARAHGARDDDSPAGLGRGRARVRGRAAVVRAKGPVTARAGPGQEVRGGAGAAPRAQGQEVRSGRVVEEGGRRHKMKRRDTRTRAVRGANAGGNERRRCVMPRPCPLVLSSEASKTRAQRPCVCACVRVWVYVGLATMKRRCLEDSRERTSVSPFFLSHSSLLSTPSFHPPKKKRKDDAASRPQPAFAQQRHSGGGLGWYGRHWHPVFDAGEGTAFFGPPC